MTAQPEVTRKKKRERSPSYPAIDLETALQKVGTLYEKEGKHFAPVATIAQDWGYSPKSSGSLLTLAALKKFGLIEEQGARATRQARPSALALKIIQDDRPDSREREEAIREAALKPGIHAALWTKYGSVETGLPSDAVLRYFLRTEKGFTDGAASEFVREFQRTIQFARLAESDTLSGSESETRTQESDTNMTANALAATNLRQPKEPSQSMLTLQLPLGGAQLAILQVPSRLSKTRWKRMLTVLAAMEPGVTEGVEDE